MYFSSVLPNDTNMNEQLVKFIELCLVDGVISDKEREVIFRKSQEFGVPEDECEIILEGMIQKLGKKESSNHKSDITESVDETKLDTSSKENKVDFTGFFQTKLRKDLISDIETVDGLLKSRKLDDSVKKIVEENKEDILFRFKGSFIVGSNFLIGTSQKEGGRKVDFSQLSNITYKDGGIFGVSGYFINDKHFDNYIENPSSGKRFFKLFKEYINQSIFSEVDNNETGKNDNTFNQEFENSDRSVFESGTKENPFIVKDVKNNSDKENINSKNDFLTDQQISKDLQNIFHRDGEEILQSLEEKLKSLGGVIKHPDYWVDYKLNWINRIISFNDQKYLLNTYPQIQVVYRKDGVDPSSVIVQVLFILGRKKSIRLDYYPFFNTSDDYSSIIKIDKRISFYSWSELIRNIRRLDSKVEIDVQLLKSINRVFDDVISKYTLEVKEIQNNNNEKVNEYDIDNNGVVDILETSDDFMKLVEKKQPEIIKIDQSMIHKFIRLNNFLELYRNEISSLFDSIRNELDSEIDRQDYLKLMEQWVNEYKELLLHSISMLVSLTDGQNLVTYYKIYEVFDKMNVFNSNWENELSSKLDSIDNRLKNMIESNNRISQQIRSLTYITQSSFENLGNNISRELKSIDSSIKFNNLLNTVQTYQMYKINQNTKSLRG